MDTSQINIAKVEGGNGHSFLAAAQAMGKAYYRDKSIESKWRVGIA